MNQPTIHPQGALQILVVGAGISGLAAAYGLRKSGHDVLVVEKTDGSQNYTNEAIPSPPNMTQMLAKLGLESHCQSFFERTDKCDFIDANSGSYIGVLPAELLRAIAKDAMADSGTIEGKKLQGLLRRMCEESGVNLRFSVTVAGITEDMPTSVILEDGEKLEADLIVVADGCNSSLRSHVVPRERLEIGVKTAILTASISMERLREDLELWPLLRSDTWVMWIGSGVQCRLHVLPRQKERCEALFSYTVPSNTSQTCDEWKIIEDASVYGLDVSALEPRLQKLLEAGDYCHFRVIETLPAADTLVSIPKKIILIGSAAHSLAPGTHQDTPMALEDAYTLSFLLSKLQKRDQLPRIISAYDEIRQPRAAHVHQYEVRRQMISKAPPGPLRSTRDERLRMISQIEQGAAAEEAILAIWGTELVVGTYNASAAAQDWWNQYGSCVVINDEGSKSATGEVQVFVKRKSESW
ncbi:hypothetical protein CPB83DRAFT_843622 [Crepidotus variabilis]|uniref:FAD-binding domain-containing protein n=1 Tax=Crepidotus variabilis TaxID=179855 RepID=A0A9P6EUL7_9AGAR|nr:hypothetical protein CPB83DRAFT_843622 [Crepidotus variabilis]